MKKGGPIARPIIFFFGDGTNPEYKSLASISREEQYQATMMSNSNNRSPIMMNIKGKSPIKKISKAARRGTKLAATAAHKGSQFYEQVQSRMAEVDSNSRDNKQSPARHRHNSAAASGSDMASAAYRSRVRDQINRFNSAAVPSQRGSNDGSNHSTSKEPRHHQNEVKTTTRRNYRQQQPDENKSLVEHVDGNEIASYNPSYYEKENESNLPASIDATAAPYSFTSKDGVRVLSPAMHRQRRKSPKKGSSSTSSPQKATSSSSKKANSSSQSNLSPPSIEGNSETTYDETEMLKRQLRALEKDNEKLMKRNSRLERKCDKLTRDNTQLMEEVEVQAAGNNSSSSTADAAHRKDDSNSQGSAASYGAQQEEQLNKRDPEEHPLIGSPLRKHMKFVHESAESNCTVTMRKAPFPLLPPEQTRVIMEARMKEMEEEQEDEQHLGMLGNVTGTPSLDVDANFALSYKKRRGKRAKDGEEGSSGEEEAVDLLTSAAFMFKTSRRNLR